MYQRLRAQRTVRSQESAQDSEALEALGADQSVGFCAYIGVRTLSDPSSDGVDKRSVAPVRL